MTNETLETSLENEYRNPCINKDIDKVGFTFYTNFCMRCDNFGNIEQPSEFVKKATCGRYKEK
jgi:hypothetical protein